MESSFSDALDQYKQNDRRHHSNAILTRALQVWLSERIDEYSAEFVKIDKLQASEEEKDELRQLNEMLDRWKNEYLENEFGLGGQGGPEPGPKPRPTPLPQGTPARIDISLTYERSGQGVSLKPKYEFYDEHDQRIRPVPFEWQSERPRVVTIDHDLNVLNTHSLGSPK